MNLTDLTEVLRDRARVDDTAHDARMAGVRARVSATRRRRAVTGVACVVLALVGIVYATLPRPQALPEPAVPPRSLPEYQRGTKLIGQAWGDLPGTTATMTFVPKSLNLWLYTQCDVGPKAGLLITVTINGHEYTKSNGCGGGTQPADWGAFGIKPGQPSVLTMTVDGGQGEVVPGQGFEVLPLPASGSFAVGIGEEVPVEEYPLPPPPSTLPALQPQFPEASVELRSDPADPLARKESTIAWPGRSGLVVRTNTPGRIRVLVDDVLVVDYSNWDYFEGSHQIDAGSYELAHGPEPAAGQTVRITVVPERITGEWSVALVPQQR
ncbi:hypothetical protein [Lentzea sp.]|uniref:hypothetical protein n=1 Tax=Lentzea sp. TaxID=56099 RepID=UPI002ED2A7B7